MERREFKTTPEQWKIVVEFLEEHPALLTGKFKNFDGDHQHQKQLWEELALRLNSMGLGTRSWEKWQLAVGRWKSKTKAKASQIRLDIEKTGGGAANSAPLNQIEERLMALIGWRSVTGDRNVELGLTPLVPVVQPTPPATTAASGQLQKQMDDTPPPLTPIKRQQKAENPKENPAKRTRFTTDKSKRMVTMSQMHKDNTQRLVGIEKNTQIMATALKSISNDLNRYVNHLIEKGEMEG